MIITTACWGFNFVITKSAAGVEPEQFRIFIYNVIRFSIASALLFLTIGIRGRNPLIGRRDLVSLAALSFVGLFMYQVFYMVGQTLTSAANVGIIYSFLPLLILVVSFVLRVETPTLRTIAGVFLGCIGLLVIIFEGGRFSIDVGSLIFLAALVCFALYAVLGKRVLERIPPATATAWIFLFGTLYQLPLALWQLPKQSWSSLAGRNVLFVLLAAVLSQYIGYTFFYYAISRLGPTKAGMYSNLTPVFTLAFAAAIRSERVMPVHMIGLGIIIAGIALTRIGRHGFGQQRTAR